MSIAQDLGRTSLVDLLGPAQGRYFASGYKDVHYDIHTMGIADESPGRIRAVCSARYPQNWSRGADGLVRTPHLSSVDAIALSILTLECLADPATLGSYHVTRVELRAPTRPHTDLNAVPVSLQIDGDLSQADLLVDADVGGLRVHLQLRRDNDCGVRRHTEGPSVYTGGFRHTRVISSLQPDGTESSVVASHLFEVGSESVPQSLTGVESAFAPAVTAIDLLVTLGQMAQAAIYVSIPVEQRRGDLWMRSMTIEVGDPPLTLPFSGRSKTTVSRDRILDRSGQKLHDIDVESSLEPSVLAWARLAYIEPAASPARDWKAHDRR